MTHILEYKELTQRTARSFLRKFPEHQAFVYAVESVVATTFPQTTVSVFEARRFIENICDERSVDTPIVQSVSAIGGASFVACASHKHYTISLKGKQTKLTLCHELAHLLCDSDVGHEEPWRSLFVDITRQHIGVEQGAFLHSLYTRLDLPTQWN